MFCCKRLRHDLVPLRILIEQRDNFVVVQQCYVVGLFGNEVGIDTKHKYLTYERECFGLFVGPKALSRILFQIPLPLDRLSEQPNCRLGQSPKAVPQFWLYVLTSNEDQTTSEW